MKIHVKDYLIPHIFVGILPEEYENPQRLIIDITVTYPDVKYPSSIDQCYNYADIVDYLSKLTRRPHVDLIETIACDILDFIFSNQNVTHARVLVKKPDIIPLCHYVGVEYERTR